MAERWFFALWPDDGAREALVAAIRPLMPRGARATQPLDLHLTLNFLGELTPERLLLAKQAAGAVRAAPVTLQIDRLGCFARVLWCGPAATPPALLALVTHLGAGLAGLGFPQDPRAFRPHITVARKVGATVPLAIDPPIQWTSDQFVLARGRDGQAPRYDIACRWPLSLAP